MTPKGLMLDGKAAICPVCSLLRRESNRLVTRGKRRLESRILECSVCHRTWESVRWYLDYWLPHWLPIIQRELMDAAEDKAESARIREQHEEWEWVRARDVARAVEEGLWRPMTPSETGLNSEPMGNYDQNVVKMPDGSLRARR